MTRKLIVNLAAVAALSSTACFSGSVAAHPLGMNPYAPHALNGPTQSGHFSPYAPNPAIGKALHPASPPSKWTPYPPIKTFGPPKPPKIIISPPPKPFPLPKGPPKIIPAPIPIWLPPADVDVHLWGLDPGVGYVQTVVEGPRNCLTKTYTPDGQLVFKDLCTQEAVSAPVESAPSPQASNAPDLPNYAGKTYQDYLVANQQNQATKN